MPELIAGVWPIPAGMAVEGHGHTQADVTNLATDLAAKSETSHSHTHNHDTEYSVLSHSHSHSHAQSEVTNLVSDLAGKAASAHNHDATYSALGHTHAGGGGGPATVRLTADATNSTTALADATGLSFAVSAGAFYAFQFLVMFQTEGTASGIKLAANAPANSYIVYNISTPLTATTATLSNRRAVNTGAATASIDAANANTLAVFDGLLAPTAAGTLILRFASETTTIARIKAGSAGVLYTL